MTEEHAPIRRPNGTFLPGVSGNPDGRTRGAVSLVALLKGELREHPERGEAIVAALLDRAAEGDPACIKLALDRIDGPLALKIEGMSEAQMRAWLMRMCEALMRRLPVEHHQAIAEALWETCGDDEGGPLLELPEGEP